MYRSICWAVCDAAVVVDAPDQGNKLLNIRITPSVHF